MQNIIFFLQIPEFRYLRTLCTLNKYHNMYPQIFPPNEHSYLQLNPAKRYNESCTTVENLRYCKFQQQQRHSSVEKPTFLVESEMFKNVSNSTICDKNVSNVNYSVYIFFSVTSVSPFGLAGSLVQNILSCTSSS